MIDVVCYVTIHDVIYKSFVVKIFHIDSASHTSIHPIQPKLTHCWTKASRKLLHRYLSVAKICLRWSQSSRHLFEGLPLDRRLSVGLCVTIIVHLQKILKSFSYFAWLSYQPIKIENSSKLIYEWLTSLIADSYDTAFYLR